jgi:acyl carrier protein
MKDEIFQKVAKAISENNKIPLEDITINSTFEDLGMDSLDGITILNELENAYNITLPNEVVTTLKSVKEVVDALDDYLKNNNQETPSEGLSPGTI